MVSFTTINKRLILVLCIVLAAYAPSLFALSYVGGQESGIWTFGWGPYVALTDVIVPADEVLTIGEGVIIQFEPGTRMIVEGELRVEGANNGREVRFQSNEPGETWYGLQITSGLQVQNNSIRNARFSECIAGIEVISSRLEIEGTLIHVNTDIPGNNIYALRIVDGSAVTARWLTSEVQTTLSNARVLYGLNSFLNLQDCDFTLKVGLIPGGNEAGAVLDLNNVDGAIRTSHLTGTTKNSDIIGAVINNSPDLDFTHCSIRLETEANTISQALKITHTAEILLSNLTIDLLPLGESTLMYGIEVVSDSYVQLINSIISNSALVSKQHALGAVVINEDAELQISYCDFFNTILPDHPNIEMNRESLIFNNPAWVSNDPPDYHLQETSPCIDAGYPIAGNDPDGTPPDLGMYYYHHNVDVNENNWPVPTDLVVSPAYPNPFNPGMTIPFTLPQAGMVSITVFNVLGQQVFNQSQNYQAGFHHFLFDVSSEEGLHGQYLGSGVYYLQVRFGGSVNSQKVMLLR